MERVSDAAAAANTLAPERSVGDCRRKFSVDDDIDDYDGDEDNIVIHTHVTHNILKVSHYSGACRNTYFDIVHTTSVTS